LAMANAILEFFGRRLTVLELLCETATSYCRRVVVGIIAFLIA